MDLLRQILLKFGFVTYLTIRLQEERTKMHSNPTSCSMKIENGQSCFTSDGFASQSEKTG